MIWPIRLGLSMLAVVAIECAIAMAACHGNGTPPEPDAGTVAEAPARAKRAEPTRSNRELTRAIVAAALARSQKYTDAELTAMACRSSSGAWRCMSSPPAQIKGAIGVVLLPLR